MHIPDGYLDPQIAGASAVVAVAAVGVAAAHARPALDARRVATAGVVGAGVFALQMLNAPVTGGTSGHMIGAAQAVALLGTATGAVVMALVLAVQVLVC